MSGLPRSHAEFLQASSQLPVSWYFDPEVYALEQQLLFANGPGYVGHELMVPEAGDYHTLAWMDHAKMLVRNANGVELMHNICRHRQSIMMKGRGNQPNFVCPLHRWTYDVQGKLIGAPHFAETPCKSLAKTPLQHWNGLLFAGKRDVAPDLARLGVTDFDFSGYVYDRTVVHEYRQNWKTFVEVYLEDYHVEPFHPGLGQFVQCADLRWEFGDHYSVQTVGVKDSLMKPGTPTYAKWHEAVRGFRNDRDPEHGAAWMVYYPNIMLEWYPHVLVI